MTHKPTFRVLYNPLLYVILFLVLMTFLVPSRADSFEGIYYNINTSKNSILYQEHVNRFRERDHCLNYIDIENRNDNNIRIGYFITQCFGEKETISRKLFLGKKIKENFLEIDGILVFHETKLVINKNIVSVFLLKDKRFIKISKSTLNSIIQNVKQKDRRAGVKY